MISADVEDIKNSIQPEGWMRNWNKKQHPTGGADAELE